MAARQPDANLGALLLRMNKVRIIRRHDSNSISPYQEKPPSKGLGPWLSWAIKLSLVGLVVLAGFAVYLDAVVQEKFSGKRWTIPAKVYARPLELFVGQKLSKDDFLTELDALGYRREAVSNGPGAAAVNGNTVDLNTRGFQFYEGLENRNRCACASPAITSPSCRRPTVPSCPWCVLNR